MYDRVDYLSSLGKSQTAAVKRDADIGVAQANRDAGIRVRILKKQQLYTTIMKKTNPVYYKKIHTHTLFISHVAHIA